MLGTMIIRINTFTLEDQAELHGCPIDDAIPEDGIVWVRVPLSEINCYYTINGGMYPDEFWGSKFLVEETEITVHRCEWEGHPILNDQEVAEELEAWSNQS